MHHLSAPNLVPLGVRGSEVSVFGICWRDIDIQYGTEREMMMNAASDGSSDQEAAHSVPEIV